MRTHFRKFLSAQNDDGDRPGSSVPACASVQDKGSWWSRTDTVVSTEEGQQRGRISTGTHTQCVSVKKGGRRGGREQRSSPTRRTAPASSSSYASTLPARQVEFD